MKELVFLDAKTVGDDISLGRFKKFGNFISYQNTLTKEETFKRVKNANIIITNKVVIDKDVIESATKLELICVAATGMNNIDLEYAKLKGITVKNVNDYSTDSVAQHTFTLLFYLLGRVRYYDDLVKSGKWCESEIFTNLDKPYHELNGKTWGIVGLGNIGKRVADIAECFGAKVIYYSTSGKNRDSRYKRVDLSELLSSSDIVSIHAPLNSQTSDLITREELKLLKDEAILLNLGRGGIVNEKDLANIIDEKHIFAGLDVTKNEPIEKDNPLLKIKNKERLIITPHIAWSSIEAREVLVKKIETNIENFLGGEKNG